MCMVACGVDLVFTDRVKAWDREWVFHLFLFFFSHVKVTNTFVLLFWADDTLNYELIYNPGIRYTSYTCHLPKC